MSIVVYILIIIFGFLLIVNHIFEHGFKAIEGMVTGENINSLADANTNNRRESGRSLAKFKKKIK